MKKLDQFIELLKRERPVGPFEPCFRGWGLRKRGEDGCYRRTYAVGSNGYVVKFPHRDYRSDICVEECVNHSLQERNCINDINRLAIYKAMRRYIPKIYFCDEETGVLVMKRYAPVRRLNRGLSECIENLVTDLFNPKYELDIGSGNVGRDDDNSIVLVDLGLIYER